MTSDVLVDLLYFLPHPAVKDFYSRLLGPTDSSFRLGTELRIKIIDFLKAAGVHRFFGDVLTGVKSLQEIRSPKEDQEFLAMKKKLGKYYYYYYYYDYYYYYIQNCLCHFVYLEIFKL